MSLMDFELADVQPLAVDELRFGDRFNLAQLSYASTISLKDFSYPASEASYGIGSREGENSVVSYLTPLRGWH